MEKHLEQLKREGLIKGWHDRKIVAGSSRFQGLDQHIKNADIILLLVSPDSLSSDYCYEVEMQITLDRYKNHEAQVIPVILRPCDWQSSLFYVSLSSYGSLPPRFTASSAL
ncbi:toll/interleukin-1 receptor domain-containing protein [Dictyobacter aurantiacus]|uniref:toll/interleukin-1 receptor domain-containing protein n=1 Tax=Dictyobacter aurantiacus TaxID=1936993 RepID=UPI00135C81A5|nr:toll/interleukin-1 receptor domain-containing protein [Dictyobacter aurantiacus]